MKPTLSVTPSKHFSLSKQDKIGRRNLTMLFLIMWPIANNHTVSYVSI